MSLDVLSVQVNQYTFAQHSSNAWLSLDGTRTPLLPPPTPGRPLAILAGSYS